MCVCVCVCVCDDATQSPWLDPPPPPFFPFSFKHKENSQASFATWERLLASSHLNYKVSLGFIQHHPQSLASRSTSPNKHPWRGILKQNKAPWVQQLVRQTSDQTITSLAQLKRLYVALETKGTNLWLRRVVLFRTEQCERQTFNRPHFCLRDMKRQTSWGISVAHLEYKAIALHGFHCQNWQKKECQRQVGKRRMTHGLGHNRDVYIHSDSP